MITGVILIVVGLAMVILEFFLPGGVMGVAGAVVTVSGLVIFGIYSPYALLTALVVVCTVIVLALMAHFALRRIRKMGKKGTIYLETDQEGYRASGFEKALVGKKGIALTDLHPSGHVTVDEQRWQAVAQVGYLEKGTEVLVVGGEGAHLIVRKLKTREEK